MSNLQSRDRAAVNGGNLLRPFAEMWGFDPLRSFAGAVSGFPGIEVTRTDAGYTVEMPVPGYKPEDVEVTLEDGLLTVRGKNEKRQFTRTITVPDEVDADRIEANVEYGMLTLTLNLLPKAQPKRIEIKAR